MTNRELAQQGEDSVAQNQVAQNQVAKKTAGILRSRPIRSELDSASDQNSYSAEIRIERGAE